MRMNIVSSITLLIILVLASFSPQVQISSYAANPTDRPSPRAGHSLVYDEDRKMVLLMDGYEGNPIPVKGEVWVGAAVNVDYRDGPAPSAVEDCRCALRWVIRNARKYNLDASRLVLTGESAGSHLALITGLLPSSAGLDGECPGQEELKVAAIVNWYGVTDVVDVLEGTNQQPYAVRWLSSLPNSKEVARRVSPLEYVRADSPSILTIHGDADRVAPYDHAVRLHKALDDAKVPNQLLTIPGGTHGDFKRGEFIRIYSTIREFMKKRGIAK